LLTRVKLGNTDIDINRICLGSGSFGGSTPDVLCIEQLDYFFSIGGIFIDTALAYCDWLVDSPRSCSEKLLGNWMKEHRCRSQITLSAKGCHDKVLVPTNNALTCIRDIPHLDKEAIINDIETSLMNLQTDYLDIFTLHKDNLVVPISEIMDTLQAQKDAGKIRAYGCSNWTIKRQQEAYAYARRYHLDGFCTDQIGWCLNVQNKNSSSYNTKVLMDDEAYKYHQLTKIPVMAYAANGRAYFHRLVNGMNIKSQEIEEYDNDINQQLLSILSDLAQQSNIAVNTIVINYLLLDHGFQTIPIVGVKSIKELDICLAALDYQMPEEFEKLLRSLTR